jgi:hypothetical protein
LSPLKRKLTFLVVIAAVAACAAGAYAATQSTGTSPRQAFFNDVARRLHVTPGQLKKAMEGAFADRLAAMVASGRLTKAQASAIEQRVKSSGRYPGLGQFGPGAYGRGMRRGFGFGWLAYKPGAKLPPNVKLPPGAKPKGAVPPGFMSPAPRAQAVPFPPFLGGPAFGLLVPGGMQAVVSYLGIHPAQLMAELRTGKSLAEIARAHGKSVSGLESAIDSAFKIRLSRHIKASQLTKAQAAKLLSAVDARVAGVVNLKEHWLAPRPFRAHRLPGLGGSRPVPHRAAKQDLGALFSS